MSSRLLWLTIALGSIWLGVLLISVFSPDMVTGAYQDHLPMAAILAWIWGATATRSVLGVMVYRQSTQNSGPALWAGVGLATAVIWTAATLLSIFVPELVTGTDPTRLPLAAILTPIGAAVLTGTACQLTGALVEAPDALVTERTEGHRNRVAARPLPPNP